MSRNPYSPPTAQVADVAHDAPEPDRRDVERACKCLWYSYGVAPIAVVVELVRAPSGIVLMAGIFGLGLWFLVTRWVVSRLRAGRNWMRLLVTTVTVLCAVVCLIARDAFFATFSTPLDIVVFGIQGSLQIVAAVLLNTTRSRAWFAAARSAPRDAQQGNAGDRQQPASPPVAGDQAPALGARVTTLRIMASWSWVLMYTVNGLLFTGIGALNLLQGWDPWPYTVGWVAMSLVWYYMAYRWSRVPVLVISDAALQVELPVSKIRSVALSDIVEFQKRRFLAPRLILRDGASVSVPTGLMSKADRTLVEARLVEITKRAPNRVGASC